MQRRNNILHDQLAPSVALRTICLYLHNVVSQSLVLALTSETLIHTKVRMLTSPILCNSIPFLLMLPRINDIFDTRDGNRSLRQIGRKNAFPRPWWCWRKAFRLLRSL